MGISIWQLVIILVIVMLLFGTKKLRNIGGDIGGAIKGFRSAVKEGEGKADSTKLEEKESGTVIDAEVTREEEKEKDKA